MITLVQMPEMESDPTEMVGDDKAMEQAGGMVRKKQDSRVLLAVAALLAGLSIAVPAAILVFVYPLNHAEIHYSDGMWRGEIWWSYVYTGIALSIGFGLAGLVLAKRGETAAYRTAEASNVETDRSMGTRAKVALSFALVALIVGPVAYVVMGVMGIAIGGFAIGQWIGISLLGACLIGIALAVRPLATAASLVLPVAVVALILGPWASIPGSDANIGRSLIGVGVAGIALAVWGVSSSDPAVTRRWLLPFAIVALVLAALGNAYMFLLFGLQHLSL